MRTLVSTVTTALVAAAFVAAPGGGATPGPKLRLASAEPFVVVGSGFRAAEPVTVTAMTTLGPRIVRLRATTTGTFRARLRISPQPCVRPFAIRALGAAGSAATVTMRLPPCIPPPID